MIKKVILLNVIFFLFVSGVKAELVDRVVAVVNDDVITLSEIESEGKKVFQEIASRVPPAEMEKAMDQARQEILSSLIDKLLIEQRAGELDVTVSMDEIDAAIQSVADSNHLDLESFKGRLVAEGFSLEEYKNRLKWQILQSKLINYEIRSKIVVTDERARQYYKKQYSIADGADGYHIFQIGLQWGDGKQYETKEQAVAQAEDIKKRAQKGQSFSELARLFSTLPSAADGGDLGVFKKDELATYMKETVLALKPGDISPVLETSDHIVQILKLLSIKSGDTVELAPFESVKEEIIHILQEDEMKKQFDRWVKDIREQAYIKEIL